MTVYVLHSLAWSLAGFVIGWAAGSLGRDVHQTREAIVPSHARNRTARVHMGNIIGVVVVALALITLITGVHNTRGLQQATECQARFNDIYRAALIERSESTAHVRRAQTDMANALSAPGAELNSPPVREVLRRYLNAIRDDENSRTANPIPDNTTCPR